MPTETPDQKPESVEFRARKLDIDTNVETYAEPEQFALDALADSMFALTGWRRERIEGDKLRGALDDAARQVREARARHALETRYADSLRGQLLESQDALRRAESFLGDVFSELDRRNIELKTKVPPGMGVEFRPAKKRKRRG